ncbi:hypothetical protein LTR84_008560 [Exophiala bonariae]|uniref:aldehyde dehydrogenase (NAD(+)) n=1 Tax=Exophiala bonariae TaxID=1690606 RepID=A0AAV9MZN1_9EURO|nr:hypothetical protein LTR84_008560 [Exophiala bonariae]
MPDSAGKPSNIETRLFINGDFVPSISGQTFDVINPATEQLAASVYEASPEDVDRAVKAAKDAFPAWAALDASKRGDFILKLAEAIEQNLEEIGYLEAVTMGKPYLKPPYNWVGHHTVEGLKFFASLATAVAGETSLNTNGFVNLSFRQPYGVTAAIIPWNGPSFMLCNKIGPSLVAGNTMVLKTSEKSPLSALTIARLCQEIGLPKGVLNILSGFGRPCGEALAKHMDVRKISFTGSVPTGKAIKKAAAESNLKNVTLELGGKSPLVIFDDADLEQAIPAAAVSAVVNSGQGCILSTRLYVHEKIFDRFLDGLKVAMTKIGGEVNDPTMEATSRGPQADKIQFDRIMGYLQYAKDQKLDIVLGGGRAREPGYFIDPTIIVNAPEYSRVMKEEIFGPVVCVNSFKDEEDVIRRSNDSIFGLYASIFTRDISRALRIAMQFEAGSVAINATSPLTAFDMPMGGWKQSGDGREFSRRAWESWMEQKTVYIKL